MSTPISQRDRPSPWPHSLGAVRGLYPPLVLLLGALLLVRILTDDRSAADSRHSGSLNLSSLIAIAFILLAGYLLLQQRRGMLPAALAMLWLCVWMGVAVHTSGASTEALREGVREVSVVALAVIVYNARGTITVPIAARLVQLVGCIPAVLALYQLATHTGMDIAGNIRAHGTFAHPNSAAMFFAIAATASLWMYLDAGRRVLDAILTALFCAALIATFSIDGLATASAMLLVLGALRPGPLAAKLVPCAVAAALVLVFFATPLGSKRVAGETATSLSAAERGETTSTLDTRLYRWKTLLPEWERSPVVGQGLGVTTTAVGTRSNPLNGLLPHNEYIRYLVETGIIGVVILLAALVILIRQLLRLRGDPRDSERVNGAALALAVVAGCLVNSLADNTLLNSPTCYAAILIVTAALAVAGYAKQPEAAVAQTA
ncbi:MAG TPA: O-antigen ligase family protein [Solirubrobacteraceae bacterium]|jgi:O-antigen ligase|nr:O-antigen ligase family protein [Solirubrobacteraceae bacterium]